MTSIYPLVIFSVVAVLWIMLGIQSHRLFYLFRGKYPEIAKRDIPYAFKWVVHPEKFFYFFRDSSEAVLKGDPEVWKLRQQVLLLMVLSIVVPFLGLLDIAIVVALAE